MFFSYCISNRQKAGPDLPYGKNSEVPLGPLAWMVRSFFVSLYFFSFFVFIFVWQENAAKIVKVPWASADVYG